MQRMRAWAGYVRATRQAGFRFHIEADSALPTHVVAGAHAETQTDADAGADADLALNRH